MAMATKEMTAGQELPPVYKVIRLENMRLFTMWTNLNTHTGWEVAKKSGVPAPI